jgi:ketosteroid isomerase-like protein
VIDEEGAMSSDSGRVSTVQAEISTRLARHAAALERGDVDGALQLYTEDAVVRPANMEPVRGHDALRTFFTRWFAAMHLKDAAYTTEELDVHGDTAYQLGTYRGLMQPHGRPGVPDRGSFTIVWKRQADSSWKYHRGIFNSSLPVEVTTASKGQ